MFDLKGDLDLELVLLQIESLPSVKNNGKPDKTPEWLFGQWSIQ